jgi:hypothetical protein
MLRILCSVLLMYYCSVLFIVHVTLPPGKLQLVIIYIYIYNYKVRNKLYETEPSYKSPTGPKIVYLILRFPYVSKQRKNRKKIVVSTSVLCPTSRVLPANRRSGTQTRQQCTVTGNNAYAEGTRQTRVISRKIRQKYWYVIPHILQNFRV